MTRRAFGLAVLSGLLLAAAYPRYNLPALAWIGLVPLLLALKGQSVKNGFWLGGISGFVFFVGTVYWVTYSVYFYGNVPLVPSLLITLLLCAYLALYPAVFGAVLVLVGTRRPSLLVPAAPAVWTSLELVRTYAFSGFPWALLGYSQYPVLPVIQIADITGVYGVSFLLVLVNISLAEVIKDREKTGTAITAALVIAVVLAYGFFRLRSPASPGTVAISVIQGNIEQDKKWNPAYQSETIEVYKRLTREALKQHPDLVIWPETSTPFYFGGDTPEDKRLTGELMDFVRKNAVPLLFGSPTYEIKQHLLILRNSAFLLSNRGELAERYNKFHLVPFGEYVPLKRVFFFVEKMVQSAGDFFPGGDYTVMKIRDGGSKPVTVSTVICYEIIFPDLVRKFIDRGAGILTTITNDAWFGKTAAPYQHFSMAVFRAVENRVPLARAANTGISGFIDSQGHILAATGIFAEAAVTRAVAPGTTKTFYTRFGDIFSYLCSLFSIVVLITLALKSRSDNRAAYQL